MNTKAIIKTENLILPTYAEPAAQDLPMFAENRVHQRTSGDPYPNKVVTEVDRTNRLDKEYISVCLENDYVKIVILPELGGRIYSATDKKTGYDFFYKQHVIKPALIGVLGSRISGGLEFNWPFHHRSSGYMACDFKTEEMNDGSVACHLSEHDPIDRMRGTFSIILRPDAKFFETRVKLYNRTDKPHSFLWWENAAVPVNESYQIFFPQDVKYVNFHYLKSRTTFPVAGNGVFNGIPMKEPRDISWHKNTREATSYFASASDYDFFGGYDHAKRCGVVHIGDHHISPGKKMFTWAYGQLSKSWENALTDTDGQYAELMAGSYSDNQPDFSWLAPYETKEFSQYWYPISELGTPTFANLNCAFALTRGGTPTFSIQSCRTYEDAILKIFDGERVYLERSVSLSPDSCLAFPLENVPELLTVSIKDKFGNAIAEYSEQKFDEYNMPDPITDMPLASDMNSVQELYLAGVHVDQYRDPAVRPDAYWKRALERDICHVPSLIAMARFELNEYRLDSAKEYSNRAIAELTKFNARPQSGEAYYVYAQILEALDDYSGAYDNYYKAAYASDYVGAAMTRIAVLDMRKRDFSEAVRHAEWALDYGRKNSLARAVLILAKKELGESTEREIANLTKDPLDHLLRFVCDAPDFYSQLLSNPTQTCIDLAEDLHAMGRYSDAIRLLCDLIAARPDQGTKSVLYLIGYFSKLCGKDAEKYYEKASLAPIGPAFCSRNIEIKALSDALVGRKDEDASILLGSLLYHKRNYEKASELFQQCKNSYIAKRNLAVAYFSHLGRENEALAIMRELTKEYPDDEELLYETVVLMNKMNADPKEKIALILSHISKRDDIAVELAKAYNQLGEYQEAIDVLMARSFVPCEGGEHAIADQYIFAHLGLGTKAAQKGDISTAAEFFKKGQTLPQNLGAGIWNHCKRIPLKYREALCLEKLGDKEAAKKIFRYIAETEIEYFSNMHLPELPVYRALCYDKLGDFLQSRKLITAYRRIWEKIKDGKDNGFFATTPFFIPFIDKPEKLRRSKYLYLTALCDRYVGENGIADEKMRESFALNNDNLFALIN